MFETQRRRRKPSLTPMIDVVFLLLVFFMLAVRFGADNAIPMSPALFGTGQYTGAPRLITVSPEGLRLNGVQTTMEALPAAVRELMPAKDAIVVMRAAEGATLQDIVRVLDTLSSNGINRVVLME